MLNKKVFQPKLLSIAISLITTGFIQHSFANDKNESQNDEKVEKIQITGSYIRSAGEDAATPVQVLDRGKIDALGVTTIADVIGKLSISSGSENQTETLTQNATQGTSNINLRGLGLSSTLVLINGRRQTVSGALPNDGSVFVDSSTIPIDALDRVEVLKEGAASTYGSDAIAGVVNFITRKDFDGLQINGGYQTLDRGNQHDSDIGFVWGTENNDTNFLLSGHYLYRTPMSNAERPELIDNAVSGLGSSFLLLDNSTVTDGPFQGHYVAFENVPQPNCENLPGGVYLPQKSGARCGFAYGSAFNMINTEKRRQLYANLSHEFDDVSLFTELGWTHNSVTDSRQSPSFPNLTFPKVSETHPNNPFGVPVVLLGRPLAYGYDSPLAPVSSITTRASLNLKGSLLDDWNWDVALTYSENEFNVSRPDTVKSKLNAALSGQGGVNGDQYFDPFNASNNDQDIIDYISTDVKTTRNTDSLVFDAVVNGELFEIDSGYAGFAFGVQFREEGYQVSANEIGTAKFDENGNQMEPDLIFLGDNVLIDVSQNTYAAFLEMKLPVTEDIEITAALRYENLDTDSSLDPKIALRWQLTDNWILRASASTSFRKPSLSQTYASVVSLQGIVDTDPVTGEKEKATAFIRVNSKGTKNLKPEKSDNYNLGLIYKPSNDLEVKLDYWQIEYTDLITVQNAQGILDSDRNHPQAKRTETGTLKSIDVNYFNSSSVEASGFDFEVFANIGENWSLNTNFSHFLNYDLTLPTGEIIEAAGYFNFNNFARSLPKTKATSILSWHIDNHDVSFVIQHISSYKTRRQVPEGESQNISSFNSVDAQYTYRLPLNYSDTSEAAISFGIKNLFDNEPPRVYDGTNLSFDSRQHSPLGRIFYIKAKYNF